MPNIEVSLEPFGGVLEGSNWVFECYMLPAEDKGQLAATFWPVLYFIDFAQLNEPHQQTEWSVKCLIDRLTLW